MNFEVFYMETKPKQPRGVTMWTTLMSLILILSGCVNDSDNCHNEDPMEDGARFHLQFTIMTRNANNTGAMHRSSTRAADISGDIDGAGYENFIDINDIHYLLFDKDQKFLVELDATTNNVNTEATSDDYSVYKVSADIDDEYFLENIHGTVDFYLFALANAKGWGISPPDLKRGDPMSGMFAANMFVMTTIPNTSNLMNAAFTTVPATYRQLFPMSGLQHFQVPGSMLASSSEGLAYDLTLATGKTVNLLRALAKIEIVDKINIGEGQIFNQEIDGDGPDSWCRIEKAEIDGFITQGRLVPNEDEWRRNDTFETQQVNVSSVPPSAGYEAPASFPSKDWSDRSCKSFTYDQYATNLRQDKCPVFSCYLFEYSQEFQGVKDAGKQHEPYLRITLQGNAEDMESGVIPFRLATYTNGSATADSNIAALLRNHIYRYEIMSIGQKIEIVWTVCRMDEAKAEIEFN